MAENSRDPSASAENNILGPDFFGFYASEVKELLTQDDDLLPFAHEVPQSAGNLPGVGKKKASTKNSCGTKENHASNGFASLFSNGIGAMLPESKKERLKMLLRQSVSILTQEVDEMINPVLSICRIRTCLRCKESLLRSDAAQRTDQPKHPYKKLKSLPACPDLESENMNLAKPGKRPSADVMKKCAECHATSTPSMETRTRWNTVSLQYLWTWIHQKLRNGSITNFDIDGGKESAELDDDLRFILENDSTKVMELMESHSNEISARLHHMEQNLEKILSTLMASCRVMTPAEKQQLRKLIRTLPPTSLDRVAEIIKQDKPSDRYSSNEMRVDLDQLGTVTLWRLYFYLATIEAPSTM